MSFVNLGETKTKDPKAHPSDPRAEVREWSNGITKRELFAAMAMQAIISSGLERKITDSAYSHILSADAVRIADDLIFQLGEIKELEKGKT